MRRSGPIALAAVSALLATSGPARAASYIFTTITAPGTPVGDSAFAPGINDNGQVLVDAEAPGVSFDFTDIDDVNNIHTHVYTPLPAFPGSSAHSTDAFDINNSGEAVGVYHPPGGTWQGFSYSGGSFNSVNAFGNWYTYPTGISNNGKIVGIFGAPAAQGYVYSGGMFTVVDGDPSPANATFATGINNAGVIILDSEPTSVNTLNCDSFVNVGGVNSPIAMPGEANTCAETINDKGVIVGGASNDGYNTGPGFIDVGGVFTAINFPGATETTLDGINNQGQIVGDYIDANGNTQAFVASPVPEPASWALMFIGLAGLGAVKLGSRRELRREVRWPASPALEA